MLAANPRHPGANHFYIHAVEEVEPERAVAAAERLAGLMPGAGHVVHMPGHIYIRVGRYEDAIRGPPALEAQGRAAEAEAVMDRFRRVRAGADVQLAASGG